MQYRTLGATGLQVSALSLGTMNFGALGRTTTDDVTSIVNTALESGINLIDTADVYSQGQSEELVGAALRNTTELAGRRDDIILATKAGLPMGENLNNQGSSRRWLLNAVDNSLRRLQTDYIDLYQIHRWDPSTSDEETLSALTDLQRAGKIRHFGTSEYPAHQLVQAQWTAREHHLTRFTTDQPNYSILQRGIEADVLPVAQEHTLGVLTWSPLASGWLSGAVRADHEVATSRSDLMPQRFDTSIPTNAAKLAAVEDLAALAEQAGLTLIQLALGFITAHPAVTSALIGPRTLDHLASQLAAADTVLPPDVLDRIDEIVPPGIDLAPGERNATPPALADPDLRRRH